MPRLYFLVNAILYVILAAFCTFRYAQTSRGIGYVELNRSGSSEYLVIYGGLQLGVGLFYFLLSRDPALHRIGVQFSLLFYAPIVLFRLSTLAIFRPTSAVTLGTAGLELALLIWGVIAWKGLPLESATTILR